MRFSGEGILLDIEGTTSSISFVHDVMFAFVRRELDRYLGEHLSDAAWQVIVTEGAASPATETPQGELRRALDQVAQDAGSPSFAAWVGEAADGDIARERLRTEVFRLMDADAKTTGLKALQGLIWRSGFEGGELRAHVYDDVPPALRQWDAAGLDVRIYSSGSVAAQRLFFGHTVAGDLLPLLRGHFDTTTGPKKEAASYSRIADMFGLAPSQLLFISDVVDELDAAAAAGLQTALSIRPGNAPQLNSHRHPELTSFDQLRIVKPIAAKAAPPARA